jgi:hypothetical protein
VVLLSVLDSDPPRLCEVMVRTTASPLWPGQILAVSRMQLVVRRPTRVPSLLVRQGDRPQAYRRPPSSHMRADLFEAEGKVPAPVLIDVPRRTLSAVHIDGPDSGLFLRQTHFNQEMRRDRSWKGLELPRAMR